MTTVDATQATQKVQSAAKRQEAIEKVTRIEDLPGTTNDEVQALLDLQLNY